ncbi:Histone-lysine N-methyltransferase SETMAR, partial [Araneus ventricosus]
IDAPAKYELRSFIRFLQAEGWFVENDQCSYFLSVYTRLGRVILISGVVLIHDNTRPHSTVVTLQLLEQLKWEVSDHLAYSPDLAKSDFHLFPELKNWLGGQSFQKNEEIQSKVKEHLTSLAAMFFEEGIENLVHRCDKCLNLHGDYVERNHV